jgi:hypothetical protein
MFVKGGLLDGENQWEAEEKKERIMEVNIFKIHCIYV